MHIIQLINCKINKLLFHNHIIIFFFMSDLTYIEKAKFEDFLGMSSGYVLDLSNQAFRELVAEAVEIDIYDEKYNHASGSKANRLRALFKLEDNYLVGKTLDVLVQYAMSKYKIGESVPNEEFQLFEECTRIIARLKEEGIVEHLDALQPNNNDKDFELLSKSIKESIEQNQPEVALDRLHTFVVKYVRELCTVHNVAFQKSESLNAIFGKYVNYLSKNNLLESPMSERILKYSINVIEAFNDVRNNRSLAHDNPILNYDESILIFTNVAASIKFIEKIEKSHNKTTVSENIQNFELPF